MDSPNGAFGDFEDVGVLWMHEVCRTVLDRYGHAMHTKQKIFLELKKVASNAFKVREKAIINDIDKILYTYGSPDGRL